MKLIEKDEFKIFQESNYNYIFNKNNGTFLRWGKNKQDDPDFSPFGAEIADIEISKSGLLENGEMQKCKGACEFCYKENNFPNRKAHNMTLKEYQDVINNFPKYNGNHFLTQVALGICDIDTNPDMFDIIKWTREQGIIPNYTTNGIGITKEIATLTNKYCGAVAVSYNSKNHQITEKAVELYKESGMTQVNIHFLLSEETFESAINFTKTELAKKINAVVFLQYKPKGVNRDYLHPLINVEKYRELIKNCEENNVNYGFDSCSAGLFVKSISNDESKKDLIKYAEPCESTLFSIYINSEGYAFPCSFCEGEKGWEEGIKINSNVIDIWNSERFTSWRDNLINNVKCGSCRGCSIFGCLNEI